MLSCKLVWVFTLCLIGAKGDDKPSVLIVGAGVSGIAAATKLWNEGFTNVKIVEAENYIGGRIKTVPFGDGVVDLGSEWSYGEKGNVIFDLVKDLNVLEKTPLKVDFWLSNGDKIDKDTGKKLWDLFVEIYINEIDTYKGPEINMKEYFTPRYTEKVKELFKDQPDKLKIALDALHLWKTIINSDEGSLNWEDSSALGSYVWTEIDQIWQWKDKGMKTVIDVLLNKIPDASKAIPIEEHIQFGKPVKKITWKGTPKPKVELADGTAITADYVIWTPSLGVLKEKHNSIFEPHLPENKVTAIKSLGVGAVVKILLHFPERWWPEKDFTGFTLIWSKEDAESLTKDYPKGNLMDTNWLLDVHGFWAVSGNPKVLEVWVSGKTVPDVEKMSSEDIIDGLTFIMTKFLSKDFKPVKPAHVLKSTWTSNPNFKGVWAYETVESRNLSPSPLTTLAEPLIGDDSKPKVLFAGDFSHLSYYSSANGAIETGWREANRIIKGK